MMSDFTPIRVRGKRGATPTEKWHANKKRSTATRNNGQSCQDSEGIGVSAETNLSERRILKSSPLEQLPTEIVQSIFVYSKNIDLPFASPLLMNQLSDRHMYSELCNQNLGTAAWHDRNQRPYCSDDGQRANERILNCRFMTWKFFCNWLDAKMPSWAPEEGENSVHYYAMLWTRVTGGDCHLPPAKLLRSPWPQDKIDFLAVFTYCMQVPLFDLKPSLAEIGLEGLREAIRDGCFGAVDILLRLGVLFTIEDVREAVMTFGCDRRIVLCLFGRCCNSWREDYPSGYQHPQAPSWERDPALWAWAERAKGEGDPNGAWLLEILKRPEIFDQDESFIKESFTFELIVY